MENKDIFGQARQEAIFNTIHESGGTATAEVIDKAARKAESEAIIKIGEESEEKFDTFAKLTDIIKSGTDSSSYEDVYRGIDKWVLLREDQELPGLPVQVKSSYRDCRLYKYGDPNKGIKPDPAFIRLHGIEIVLNCGPSVKPKAFRKQLHEEIRRIKLTLKGDPSLIKFTKG